MNMEKPSESALEMHGWCQMQLTKMIGTLKYSNMFKENGVAWSDIWVNSGKSISIFYFGHEENLEVYYLHRLLIGLTKKNITQKLGMHLEEVEQKPPIDNTYLFLIDFYLSGNMKVMPAQARATGLCINFSYSDIESFKQKVDSDEIEYVLGNTMTTIISNENKAEFLKLTPCLNVSIEEKSLITKENNNTLWIIRKEECHQIEFDNI